jgi:hypothetical protein
MPLFRLFVDAKNRKVILKNHLEWWIEKRPRKSTPELPKHLVSLVFMLLPSCFRS